jgi:hypothetical protein
VAYRTFSVPVHDLTGRPALQGTGFQRLVYQDHRPAEDMRALGWYDHSTPNCAHVGDPDVTVIQGNHWVDFPSEGAPAAGEGIETLHLPWRSYEQYRAKVENAGRAYTASGTKPSPRHHGMRDYQRLLWGLLFDSYLLRHPTGEEIERRLAEGTFTSDRRLADTLASPVADVPIDEAAQVQSAVMARAFVQAEGALLEARAELAEARQAFDHERRLAQAEQDRLRAEIMGLHQSVADAADRVRDIEASTSWKTTAPLRAVTKALRVGR